MYRKIFLCIFCLLFLVVAPALSADLTTQKYVLKNGLIVLITEMPESPSVSIYGLVKVGSADEGKYLGSGITHFMEHMLFKGTQRRGVGQIPAEVQSLGGTINASTHLDFTIYTLTLPKDHFEQGMDILSDMLMNAVFDPDEIEKERDVVLREMRMHHDRPEQYLSEVIFRTVYHRHPYRIPIIGFPDLIRPLTRKDFFSYYKKHYAPNNMVLSIAGNVTVKDALAMARTYFAKHPRGQYLLRNLEQESGQIAEQQNEEYYPTELLRMSVCYQGVDVLDKDMVALDALSTILGGGESSRLYQSVYKKQKLVSSISAENFTPLDRGIFEIDVTDRQDRVPRILSAIDQQINLLIKKGVDEQELTKIISSSLKSLYMNELTSYGVAYRTAVDEAVTGKDDFTQWYIHAFERLTPEDIVRVAKKYLVKNHRSVVVLKPKEWEAKTQVSKQEAPLSSNIERVTLDNGLTVLLKEDHTVPLTWINLVFNGGIYADPQGLDGLSNLTSRLWVKGSHQYPYKKITQLTAQKGISFFPFSGNQSFGIRMNLLSRDLDFSLKLLSDVVLHPLFDKEIFLEEKDQMQTEIMSRNDNISAVSGMGINEMLFAGYPLARTSLGTKESLDKITRADVLKFYHRKTAPSNAVLSVFGDFKRDEVLKELNRYFKEWKGQGAGQAPPEKTVLSPISEPKERTQFMDKEQSMVSFGFQAKGFQDSDRYGLELLGAILGSPFKGRMFSTIRDKLGLAYTLGGGYQPFKRAGSLVFFVKTLPGNVEQVRKTFEGLVADIQDQGVKDDELQSMKAYLIGRHQRSFETNESTAFLTALDELYGLGYQSYKEYDRQINAVSSDDIYRLAKKYMDTNHMVMMTVLSKEKQEKSR